MSYTRWYDRNPTTREVFGFIQRLDDYAQAEIAQDIIQILMTDLDLDIDYMLHEIDEEYNYNYEGKRWYDKNPDLHSSFEIIKNLPAIYQKYVMNEILESALLMYYEHNRDYEA